MSTDAISQLEQQVDALLRSAYRLREENKLLNAQKKRWLDERGELLAQKKQAREAIEGMLTRLKEVDES